MSNFKPITTELEYQEALLQVKRLHNLQRFQKKTLSMYEQDKYDVLKVLIKAYEESPEYISGVDNSVVEIKKLGVSLHDNDFEQILKHVLQIFLVNGICEFSKREVVQLFNQIAGAIYWIYCGECTDDDYWAKNFPQNPYLRVTENQILLNEEVTQFIDKTGRDCNWEFVYLDFDTLEVYSF